MKATSHATAAALAALIALTTPVLAQAEMDTELNYRGTRHVCTGTAEGSRGDPRWAGYSTKFVFVQKDGEYLADVAIVVQNSAGATVLEVTCPTPWLLIALPPGQYRVSAVADEAHRQSFGLSIGAGRRQSERIVRFPDLKS
jgi:hypothetical protein